MGNCNFCNKPAGFFRKQHKECLEKFNKGKIVIIELSRSAVINSHNSQNVLDEISSVASKCFIPSQLVSQLIISGWEQAVESAFEDGVLTQNEEDDLFNFANSFSLEQKSLDKNGYYSKIIKGAILRDIMEGTIPERVKISGSLPFNFQKDEKLVWVFQNVDYYEKKTRKQYVGGYQGVSVKIAKGIYYRTGSFKGHPVETTETQKIDNGIFAVTDKHIYFSGSSKNFKINFNKIVTFKPYSDGLEIQKDTSTAKPQSFLTGDGWFTYNLVMNLSNIH